MAKIKEFGLMVKDNKGNVRESVYYKTYIRMNKTFLEISRHFGMSPSSRSNMNFEPKKPIIEPDPLNNFQL